MKANNYKNPTTKKNSFQVNKRKFIAFNKILDFYSRDELLLGIDKKRGKAYFFQGDEDIQDLVDRHFCSEEVAILRCKAALKDFRVMIFDYRNLRKKHPEKETK
ncbi:MAG: hypothetical protein OEY25_03765 [Candidatus Aminicenantes bacterium]|nr:hypothetical protein [Candidatus Aminicenantes bacterium]MDH5705040.1 hypothetical protein [Candidatus Aminicenantes bacterium]